MAFKSSPLSVPLHAHASSFPIPPSICESFFLPFAKKSKVQLRCKLTYFCATFSSAQGNLPISLPTYLPAYLVLWAKRYPAPNPNTFRNEMNMSCFASLSYPILTHATYLPTYLPTCPTNPNHPSFHPAYLTLPSPNLNATHSLIHTYSTLPTYSTSASLHPYIHTPLSPLPLQQP